MPNPLVLGFCGRAHSGKTTACRAIERECEFLGLPYAVGDIGASVLSYCIENELLPNKKREDLNKAELQVLVDTGLRMRQERGEDFWLNRIEAECPAHAEVFLIPNVRYYNEHDWVHTRKGYTIKLVSLNDDGTVYISPDRDPNHPSETCATNANADFNIVAKGWQDRLVELFAAQTFLFIRQKESKVL